MSCCSSNVTITTTEENEKEEEKNLDGTFYYPPLYKQPAFLLFCFIIAFIAFFFLLFNYQEPDEQLKALKTLKETLKGPFNTAKVTRSGNIEPDVHYFTETAVEIFSKENSSKKKKMEGLLKKNLYSKIKHTGRINNMSESNLEPPQVLDLENLLNIELELIENEKSPVLIDNFPDFQETEVKFGR